jgi:hypothetical protein
VRKSNVQVSASEKKDFAEPLCGSAGKAEFFIDDIGHREHIIVQMIFHPAGRSSGPEITTCDIGREGIAKQSRGPRAERSNSLGRIFSATRGRNRGGKRRNEVDLLML